MSDFSVPFFIRANNYTKNVLTKVLDDDKDLCLIKQQKEKLDILIFKEIGYFVFKNRKDV